MKDINQFEFTGRHFIANYMGCNWQALNDLAGLTAAMERGVRASGATLLKSVDHVFSPAGFTILMLLSESHASIHTYPEQRSCFVDLFTCGDACLAERFDEVLRSYLQPTSSQRRIFLRNQKINEDFLQPFEVKSA